jgi:hypothetical protein
MNYELTYGNANGRRFYKMIWKSQVDIWINGERKYKMR